MTARWIEALTGSLEQKKQYRSAKARIEALAEPHRTAATAMHRYFLYYGGVADGDVLVRMLTDLADLHVLRGVDLDIPQGSVFALLGSNGAGKTTLIRVLSTLTRADAGSATVNGFDVTSDPLRVRETISLTGQFAAVDEILTGRENPVLVAKLRHLPAPGAVADALLARFGLTDAASRRAGAYSGGMRRRLDIAMSLVGEPPVIYLDEPTTGLDPEARLEVWTVVRELAGNGTTVLLTTQYLDEAEQLADRIAILHQGRVIANGTLEELTRLLPAATVEYVKKQPTLEEIFLALTGASSESSAA